MEREERPAARAERRAATKQRPMALDAVDLLAGLAPGLELETDAVPAGVADVEQSEPSVASVNDIGRLLRQLEPTVRRLIRTPGIEPAEAAAPSDDGPMPGPFAPGTPDKPGE